MYSVCRYTLLNVVGYYDFLFCLCECWVSKKSLDGGG